MVSNVFNVRFSTGPRLGPGEVYFPWDEDCWGTATFEQGVIRLSGKHRMGVAGNLLTLGPAQALTKSIVAKDAAEAVSVPDLARVVVRKTDPRGPTGAFRLYQRLEDGTLAVHSFVVGLMTRKGDPGIDEAIAALSAIVPAEIVQYEGAAAPPASAPAAAWHPDPSGRHQYRYWDGVQWTSHVSDDGQQSVDPLPGRA